MPDRKRFCVVPAILRLNSAILGQSFADLLTTVARDWIRFAPAAAIQALLPQALKPEDLKL